MLSNRVLIWMPFKWRSRLKSPRSIAFPAYRQHPRSTSPAKRHRPHHRCRSTFPAQLPRSSSRLLPHLSLVFTLRDALPPLATFHLVRHASRRRPQRRPSIFLAQPRRLDIPAACQSANSLPGSGRHMKRVTAMATTISPTQQRSWPGLRRSRTSLTLMAMIRIRLARTRNRWRRLSCIEGVEVRTGVL